MKVGIGIVVMVAVLAIASTAAFMGNTSAEAGQETSGVIGGSNDSPSRLRLVPEEGGAALQAEGQSGEGDQDKHEQPFIGIVVETLPQPRADELGLEGGAVVRRVLDDGPSTGLLEPDDIIIRIDDEPITSAADVIRAVRQATPDQVLTFYLAGRDDGVMITIGERDTHRGFDRDLAAEHRALRGPFEALFDDFVRSEYVTESDEGLVSVTAVAGNISVSPDARTITLTPKDGSGDVEILIPDEDSGNVTIISGGHEVEIGELKTDVNTMVVQVIGPGPDDRKVLVIQDGFHPAALKFLMSAMPLLGMGRAGMKESFGPLPRFGAGPEVRERLRNRRFGLGPRLLPRVFPDGKMPRGRLWNREHLTGHPDGREFRLECDGEESEDAPGRFSMRCTVEH